MDRHLEIDHKIAVTDGGTTELANLQRLCRHHHDEKHADPAPRPPPDP